MCAKPWACAPGPTSSIRARSLRPGLRKKSLPTPKSVRCTWVSRSGCEPKRTVQSQIPCFSNSSNMLKPSLQLKLGQQLTMTPQLQQAIRLLQLPALELQAHIRELLETNVMLEPMEDAEGSGTYEAAGEAPAQPQAPERPQETAVEVLDEGWGEHSVGPAEAAWSGDDDERQQEFADSAGQSLREHLS